MLGMIDEEAWDSFYTDSFRQFAEDEENHFLAGWAMTKPVSPLSAAMLSDTLGYIPDCLNVKVDICSMAFGLEVRSPFLDHKLVEACAQIPETLKIHGMTQKYILKQAFMREVPSNILHRKKAGFSLPLADWFRSDLREITNDLLLSSQSRIRALFDVKKIQSMIHEHLTRRRNWHIQLWRLLVLENWLQSVSSVPASQDEDMFSVTQNSICSHASQLPA
jgi:asparagine synthase (glutamine-hydrolysing)